MLLTLSFQKWIPTNHIHIAIDTMIRCILNLLMDILSWIPFSCIYLINMKKLMFQFIIKLRQILYLLGHLIDSLLCRTWFKSSQTTWKILYETTELKLMEDVVQIRNWNRIFPSLPRCSVMKTDLFLFS